MSRIDFVITWVDGNDPEWIKEKNEYNPDKSTDAGEHRYRDMGLLRYWFRAVEKYAPWVNKVHFVTWGHLPEWLNTECEKLNIVNHKDFIPEEYLPTFSSNPIELNLHRIHKLTDKFVYFNDDMFLNSAVTPDFFFKKGQPCDFLYADDIYYENTQDVFGHIQTNEAKEISRKFSYIKSFFAHPTKFLNIAYPLKNNIKNFMKLENKDVFVGFIHCHLPIPYLKSSFYKVWEAYPKLLDYVSHNKFRTPFDVCQYIVRDYELATGMFTPVSHDSRGKCLSVASDIDKIKETVFDETCKMLCINDMEVDADFEVRKYKIISFFENKFPHKSVFEY